MTDAGASLKAALHDRALSEGFAAMGVCRPDAIPEAKDRLESFLDQGHHGQMAWMERRKDWRGDPAVLWPQARSVIVLAEAYTPDVDPLSLLGLSERGVISAYAQGRDYHDVVKKRLKRLGRWLVDQTGAEIKVFVDTAPVMEKPLAQAAGLGWQGKHTNLLGQSLGNWVFLGSIFTTAELPVDEAELQHCGTCRKCLDICPTDAFPAPFQLDARKCISYLTIEHDGPVDEALRPKMGNRIYGCDDCLAVCPWNKFAVAARDQAYWARIELRAPKLDHLAALTDGEFRQIFSGSPIKRIGRNRFVRNVLYAIGNSRVAGLLPRARSLRKDADATVRDAADWAAERLSRAAG